MGLDIKRVQAEITTTGTKDLILTGAAANTLILNIQIFNGNAAQAKIKVWKVLNTETLGNEHRIGQDIPIESLDSDSLNIGKQSLIIGDKIQIETDKQPINVNINYIEIT